MIPLTKQHSTLFPFLFIISYYYSHLWGNTPYVSILSHLIIRQQNFNKKCTRKTIKVLVHWLHVNRHVAWIQMSIWHLELRQYQSSRNWFQWEKTRSKSTRLVLNSAQSQNGPGWIETAFVLKFLHKWYCDCQLYNLKSCYN